MYTDKTWLVENNYIPDTVTGVEAEVLISESQALIEEWTGRVFEKRNAEYVLLQGRDTLYSENPIHSVEGGYNHFNDKKRDEYYITFPSVALQPTIIKLIEGYVDSVGNTPILVKRAVGIIANLIHSGQLSQVIMRASVISEKMDKYSQELRENTEKPLIGHGELNQILKMFQKPARYNEVEIIGGLA